MKFNKITKSFGTVLTLKRFAGAYVTDHTRLSESELIEALLKTAPQFYHAENVKQALQSCLINSNRDVRIISSILLKEVMLNCDEFTCLESMTDDAVINWEQDVINSSNESKATKNSARANDLEMFRFVLNVAWEHDDAISVDEKNLLDKLRAKLFISYREYRVMEAQLGQFPAPNNTLHTRTDIQLVRKHLQSMGLLASMRDSQGLDYDVIPEEVAAELRLLFGVEVRQYGYEQMLKVKYVKSKDCLKVSLEKCDFKVDGNPSSTELQEAVIERVKPSILIGGITPKDGLSMDNIKKWCGDLDLPTSGAKSDLITRIIRFYDNLTARVEQEGDNRSLWYDHYENFAARDRDFLRSQQLIDKDLEMEARFEKATDYLFEVKLGHKPLKMAGTEHPDGTLSYRDGLVLWDNKSKETEVNLASHTSQFIRYIDQSEKRVEGFIVLAPAFTEDSAAEAMRIFVETRTPIALITAQELKSLAEEWASLDKGAFNLGYLIAPGRFNRSLVKI
jgi:hypothetical protein